MSNKFISETEYYLSNKYLKDGYVIVDIKNFESLKWIKHFYLKFIKKYFKKKLHKYRYF